MQLNYNYNYLIVEVIELQLHFECNSITNYFSIFPLQLASDLEFVSIIFNLLYF